MNFNLEVYNTLPRFTKIPLDTVKMPNNSTLNHTINYIIDDDDHLITMTILNIN